MNGFDPGGFGSANLPYGVDESGRVVVAYGGQVLDLASVDGLDVGPEVWTSGSLNAFMALGPEAWARTRAQLQKVVAGQPARAGRPLSEARLQLAWEVGDYTDFYASRQHAEAMGRLLRPGEDPLPPAWLHLPIGYHGRAGTVVVSGSPVPRPAGLLPGDGGAVFGPTGRLDVEVELGFVVGTTVPRGQSITALDAGRYVFGVVLVNDWSTPTSSPSSTGRWARFSESPSPPRCRRGWCPWPRSSRGGWTDRCRTRSPPATCRWTSRAGWT